MDDLPRHGLDIKSAKLEQNNVLIESARGDIWRVWIDWDGHPLIELVKHG